MVNYPHPPLILKVAHSEYIKRDKMEFVGKWNVSYKDD